MKRLTLEHALYLAFFALALALRLYGLGAHPLTDGEAREALSVYRALNGPTDIALIPHSPAYFSLTYLNFLVFGASEAIARLAPALFGALLVFAPLFFRDVLGRNVALLTGALFAFTASLLQPARSADGSLLALFGLAFGLGAFREYGRTEKMSWLAVSGAACGLGLASGASFLTGLAVIGFALILISLSNSEARTGLSEVWARVQIPDVRQTWGGALIAVALIAATAGFVYLRGLGALTGSWMSWLGGWGAAGGRGPLTLPVFVLTYEPLLLVFGILGAVRAFRAGHRRMQSWAWLALAALLFTTLYRGRMLTDGMWLSAPLAVLAAYALADLVESRWAAAEAPLAFAQMGFIIVLLSFSMINLAAFSEQARINPPVAVGQLQPYDWIAPNSPYFFLTTAVLGVALALLVTFLFGLGWSPRAAQLGLVLGAACWLASGNLSASWGLTQLRANQPVELWWAAPERPTADDLLLLLTTLDNTANHTVGEAKDIEVTVQGDKYGALAWALRAYPNAHFVEQLDAGIFTPVVITPALPENPTLGSAYVGQSFALHRSAALDLSWAEWIGWWVYRRAPEQKDNVVLWVRQDVQQLPTVGQ